MAPGTTRTACPWRTAARAGKRRRRWWRSCRASDASARSATTPTAAAISGSTAAWCRAASAATTARTATAHSASTSSASARRRSSVIARQPPDLLAALRVEPRHRPREVRERDVAVLLHERADLGLGPRLRVLLVAQGRHVDVTAPMPLAAQQLL